MFPVAFMAMDVIQILFVCLSGKFRVKEAEKRNPQLPALGKHVPAVPEPVLDFIHFQGQLV